MIGGTAPISTAVADPLGSMTADVAGHFSGRPSNARQGVASLMFKRFDEGRQIVRVRIHVIPFHGWSDRP